MAQRPPSPPRTIVGKHKREHRKETSARVRGEEPVWGRWVQEDDWLSYYVDGTRKAKIADRDNFYVDKSGMGYVSRLTHGDESQNVDVVNTDRGAAKERFLSLVKGGLPPEIARAIAPSAHHADTPAGFKHKTEKDHYAKQFATSLSDYNESFEEIFGDGPDPFELTKPFWRHDRHAGSMRPKATKVAISPALPEPMAQANYKRHHRIEPMPLGHHHGGPFPKRPRTSS
jgi:hypothetical protein